MTDSILLVQYLVPGEQLLFSSEKAEIRTETKTLQILPPPQNRRIQFFVGALAITDRRAYMIEMVGIFSKQPILKFEAIFDSNYARQLIETTKAKNEEIKQQAKKVSSFSRAKWIEQQGYKPFVSILTDASLQKGMLGGEHLLFRTHRVFIESTFQTAPPFVSELATLVDPYLFDSAWELRIKQPLSMATKAATTGLVYTADSWLTPIMGHYNQKTNITYEPLLEIMQAKAQELSALIKELETSAT